jgi:hypothetical protein
VPDRPRCFIIMPLTTPPERLADYDNDPDHFFHVQEHLFVPAIEKAGFEAIPPAAQGSDFIHAGIISNLEQSDLVLCDMSTLNANVFFELGIRTALNLSTCMVRDSHPAPVPFDVGITNCHTYNASLQPWIVKDELPKLAAHVKKAADGGPTNSLWRRLGLTQRASPPVEENPVEAKIDLVLRQLASLPRSYEDPKMGAAIKVSAGDAELLRRWIVGLVGDENLAEIVFTNKGQAIVLIHGPISPHARVEIANGFLGYEVILMVA